MFLSTIPSSHFCFRYIYDFDACWFSGPNLVQSHMTVSKIGGIVTVLSPIGIINKMMEIFKQSN